MTVMKKDILFVDDDFAALQAYRVLFNKEFTIDIADSVLFAKALLNDNDYRIMITDLRLRCQKNDGLHLTDYVRQNHKDTKIIMVTAFSDGEIESKARTAGASHFFAKPVSFRSLLTVISGILK